MSSGWRRGNERLEIHLLNLYHVYNTNNISQLDFRNASVKLMSQKLFEIAAVYVIEQPTPTDKGLSDTFVYWSTAIQQTVATLGLPAQACAPYVLVQHLDSLSGYLRIIATIANSPSW
ncbi:hypothetical protein TNCV_4751271 [Trichonephila clavipes]|nr:hypothetical protein TNCV_4751271 [Trichonephila clavipes]